MSNVFPLRRAGRRWSNGYVWFLLAIFFFVAMVFLIRSWLLSLLGNFRYGMLTGDFDPLVWQLIISVIGVLAVEFAFLLIRTYRGK